MKKLLGAFFVMAPIMLLVMCSSPSSLEEEMEFNEALLGNEKVAINPSQMEDQLLELVNEHRVSIGAAALKDSPAAYKYAEEHNDYMISKNKLSHDNFQARAAKIAEATNAVEISENVARYYTSAEKTLEGWLNSSSHKEALEGEYTHTTLSVELDKDGRPYFTQIFIKVE